MYGAPYIFYFVLPIVKRVKIMVQRVDFEQIRQLLCPATVSEFSLFKHYSALGLWYTWQQWWKIGSFMSKGLRLRGIWRIPKISDS